MSIRRYTSLLITALSAAISMTVNAEVIHKAENGFYLTLTGYTAATPEQAYQQFVRVNEWWVASHTWFGNAQNLSIDAKAGGCFCELDGQRQVQHMVVAMVLPGQEIQLLGGLGPLKMMGLHGAMSWKFEAKGSKTEITQTYNVSGFYPEGLDALAEIVDSVQTDQLNALIAKLKQATP